MSKESADGVLFSTYSTLTSTKGKTTRVDQIADWCGGSAFEGCLIFDEAHKAKNAGNGKEGTSTKVRGFGPTAGVGFMRLKSGLKCLKWGLSLGGCG